MVVVKLIPEEMEIGRQTICHCGRHGDPTRGKKIFLEIKLKIWKRN